MGKGMGGSGRGVPERMNAARRPALLFLCLLSAIAVTLPASASWQVGAVSLQTPAGAVCPGEAVSIVWARLPEDADEFEILLRCESPIVQTLRLTVQLDPSLGSFAWRVPNVPCNSARVYIRAGIEGRGETTWAVSAPFRIAWKAEESAQQVFFKEGELWVNDSPQEGNPAALCAAGPPQICGFPGLPQRSALRSRSGLVHRPQGAESTSLRAEGPVPSIPLFGRSVDRAPRIELRI
jgi:hypothetical protein